MCVESSALQTKAESFLWSVRLTSLMPLSSQFVRLQKKMNAAADERPSAIRRKRRLLLSLSSAMQSSWSSILVRSGLLTAWLAIALIRSINDKDKKTLGEIALEKLGRKNGTVEDENGSFIRILSSFIIFIIASEFLGNSSRFPSAFSMNASIKEQKTQCCKWQ